MDSRNKSMSEWKETTASGKNLIIYEQEIRDFLPDAVLDFHVHVFNREAIPDDLPGYPVPGGNIHDYTVDELLADMKMVLPDKYFSAVIFGMPEKDYDHHSNNQYIAAHSDGGRISPLRLLRPEDDPDAVLQDIRKHRFFGVKPYLNYVTGKKNEDIEIRDIIPPPLMESLAGVGGIVMLHVPRRKRLADPVNQEQILAYADSYPDTKIVLAHIGRAYYMKSIFGQLEAIRKRANIYVDISAISNWEVLEYLFSHFDRKRILYGTDTPIGLFGMISVELNNQYTYITSKPWHLSISDDRGGLTFTCFIYETIRAVKKAVQRLGLKDSFLEDLFRENGLRLLASVNL